MSAGPGTAAKGLSAGGAEGEPAVPPNPAGWLMARLSVLPALLAMAWLLAGLPLLLAGGFTAVLMLVLSVPLAVVLVVLGLRWLPGRWPTGLAGPGRDGGATPWWAAGGVIAVAVGFGVQQMIYHSQQIIVARDPASYVQFGAWIARHGSLPIPQQRAAFGAAHQALQFGGLAFYQVGHTVVPQFMAGLPMVLAGGFWLGGVSAAVAIAPVLGACAVLTFGGLAARLTGPRWAPLAALALAVTMPEQFTSRSTYSEPLAQILFLGGLCLVIDALTTSRDGAEQAGQARPGAGRASQVVAALGGLALGLTLLVRIDGLSDILPVIPFAGLLLIGRRPQAWPLLGGLLAGGLFGLADGVLLSRPYLAHLAGSLDPLVGLALVVVVGTALAVLVFRDRGLPPVRGWLLSAAAVLPFAVLAALAVRPYLEPVPRLHHLAHASQAPYFARSLDWVFWYLGVPAVLLGALGAALLARRCLQGRAPSWILPLMVFGWIIVTVLLRPAITPNHPWASRRLVPGVLPGFILLAVWASAWLVGWLRERGYDRVLRAGLATACAAVLLLPGAITAYGLGLKSGGPAGIRLVANGLATRVSYPGEIRAVNRMCAAIPAGASVVIISSEITQRLAQVIRGMCGDPAAGVAQPGAVPAVVRGIEQAGRRPVLLASSPALLTPYGGPVSQVMALRSQKDARTRLVAPRNTLPFTMDVWMSEPGR
ncbi:MAG TPA: hypothetical protein VIX86_13415 [Streptosporangiaceae bacterium]